MTPEEIDRLSRAAERAGLAEIELTEDGTTLRLRFAADPPLPKAREADHAVPGLRGQPGERKSHTPESAARSPGVGLFRHHHPATGVPVAEPGAAVTKGQTIGFVEAGPCLRPVVAPQNGILGPPAVADGTVVGYGTIVFSLT